MKAKCFVKVLLGLAASFWFAAAAQALSLDDITGKEAGGGLK